MIEIISFLYITTLLTIKFYIIVYILLLLTLALFLIKESIIKYWMFRRYAYLSESQLHNINYGPFYKVINNKTQLMRNYVFIRDNWPYIDYIKNSYISKDFDKFEDWVSWIHNNYYDDNLEMIECLNDIIYGKTNEELISNTINCVKIFNNIHRQR